MPQRSDTCDVHAKLGGPAAGRLVLLADAAVWNILSSRWGLVQALQQAGYRVGVIAPPDARAAALEAADVRFLPLPMRGSGTSPLADALLLGRFVRLLRRHRPAALLGFTAKPNVYGSIAARLCGVPTVSTLTGLGTAFIHGRPIERLLSSLYRFALRPAKAVFFHNAEDRDLFVGRGLVAAAQARLVPGSGIDLQRYRPAPFPTRAGLTFLFVGRLLWEKGVGEFAGAARMVKRDHPDARFLIVGGFGDDRRAVPRSQVDAWVSEGIVEHAGTTDDIRPFIAEADCVVLPSWREGLPRVVLEGAAMGRPAIVADVPGCRHAIVDGQTGFLCQPRSSEAVAQAIERMIALPPGERERMGREARARAERSFGVERVTAEYLAVLKSLERKVAAEAAPPVLHAGSVADGA